MDDDSFDGDAFDDDPLDEEELLAEWSRAERQAAEVVVAALADTPGTEVDDRTVARAADRFRAAHDRGDHAARWMLRAAGIGAPADVDDQDLLVRAAAATILMVDDPGLPTEDAAAIMALELSDWVAGIVGLVQAGAGTDAGPSAIVDRAAEIAEIEGELDPDDRAFVEHGFELVLPAWQTCGAVDADQRLTPLGCWLLPTAAVAAWTGTADDRDDRGTDDGSNVIAFPDPAGTSDHRDGPGPPRG